MWEYAIKTPAFTRFQAISHDQNKYNITALTANTRFYTVLPVSLRPYMFSPSEKATGSLRPAPLLCYMTL